MKTKFLLISILFCAKLSLAQMPAGTIVAFGGNVANIPAGWLLCDGTVVSSTQYQQLFQAIGTGWGYGTGAPGSFNLPDLRGVFLRGVDFAANKDVEKNLRAPINAGGNSGNNVGSYQTDQIGPHNHNFPVNVFTEGGSWDAQRGTGGLGGQVLVNKNLQTNSINTPETRPKNVYVVYIIKT